MYSKVDAATAKKIREMFEAGVKTKALEDEEKRREAARKKAAADKQSQLLASLKRPHDDEDSKLLRKRVSANTSHREDPRFMLQKILHADEDSRRQPDQSHFAVSVKRGGDDKTDDCATAAGDRTVAD